MKQLYFLAILPPSEISRQIDSFRKKILPHVKPKEEHKKFPHVTLQHTFRREPEIEKVFEEKLSVLARGIDPFSVSTNGIGHFDKSVIYISVMPNPDLETLYGNVREFLLKEMQFREEETAKEYKPHITLEKKLSKPEFSEHWENIKLMSLPLTFPVRSLSLMKHNGRSWDELKRF